MKLFKTFPEYAAWSKKYHVMSRLKKKKLRIGYIAPLGCSHDIKVYSVTIK